MTVHSDADAADPILTRSVTDWECRYPAGFEHAGVRIDFGRDEHALAPDIVVALG